MNGKKKKQKNRKKQEPKKNIEFPQPNNVVTLNVPPKFGETIIPTVKKTTPFKLDTTPQVQQPKVAPVSIYDDNAISMGDFQKLQQQPQQSNNSYGAARERTLNDIQNTDRNLLDDIKGLGKWSGANIVQGMTGFNKGIFDAIGAIGGNKVPILKNVIDYYGDQSSIASQQAGKVNTTPVRKNIW